MIGVWEFDRTVRILSPKTETGGGGGGKYETREIVCEIGAPACCVAAAGANILCDRCVTFKVSLSMTHVPVQRRRSRDAPCNNNRAVNDGDDDAHALDGRRLFSQMPS